MLHLIKIICPVIEKTILSLILINTHYNLLTDNCISKMPNGFHFIKSYPIQTSTSNYTEASYVFTTGTTYTIVTCCNKKPEKIEIFDSMRNKVADVKSDMVDFPIQYNCRATGIYYIRITITEGSGEIILGFKRG